MYDPTLKELMIKCREWGVELDEEKLEHTMNKTKGVDKYSRWDLTKLIVKQTIKSVYPDEVPNTVKYINSYESAMLCARFPELKPEQQKLLLTNNNEFYAEQKFNGYRCTICYTPKEGFKIYGNNRDTDSLLISDNTEQVLFINNGIESKPEDFLGKYKNSFVLDGEVIVNTKYVDATAYGGELTDSELNAVGTLMQIAPEVSHEIQRTQKDCQLKFMIFDIRYFNGDLMNKPLKERNKIRDMLLQKLAIWNLPFYNVPRIYENKEAYFEKLTSEGKEGVVFKNDQEVYTPDKTRGKLRQIKWKRTVSQILGDDMDGFIIGFEPSTEGKAFENYIGAVKIGIYLNTIEGEEKLHHIASISGLPMDLRKAMTVIDKETGKPTLNPKYLNRCLTFSGFDIKTKSLRVSHAKVENWSTCWRPEKTPDMCSMQEEVLRSLAL